MKTETITKEFAKTNLPERKINVVQALILMILIAGFFWYGVYKLFQFIF